MKIILLYPKITSLHEGTTRKISKRFWIYNILPPLGILYIASSLINNHHHVLVIDANADHLSDSEIAKKIKSFQPDLIGISIYTHDFLNHIKLISLIKSFCSAPIVAGGVHMSIYPKETMAYKCLDYGIIGDGENTMLKLVNFLNGHIKISEINGLIYRENNEIIVNYPPDYSNDLNELPFPARHLIDVNKYQTILSRSMPITTMISVRGCPFHCTFCEMANSYYRERNPQNIVNEMEECQNKFHIKEINFYDSNFILNKAKTIEVCKEILNRGLKIDWTIRARLDHVDEEILINLFNAGCYRIFYGIESADPNILKNIDKYINIDSNKIKNIIDLTKYIGISPFGYFIFGSPGETQETINASISLFSNSNLDYIQITRVCPWPGSELYQIWKTQNKSDMWLDYIAGNIPQWYKLQPPSTELSINDLDTLIKKAYRIFYLRPSYIKERILSIKSSHELLNHLKGFILSS